MSWIKVISKRSGFKWDVFPFGGMNRRIKESSVTSFYVSAFPDYFNAKRLFELFGCSGNVAEVAISPRRNNVGKRFAFARFWDVEDGRILAIRLDNILVEGKKIHVNLPRFDRAKIAAPGRITPSIAKRHGGPATFSKGPGNSAVNPQVRGKSGRKVSYAAALIKGQSYEDGSEGNNFLEFHSEVGLKKRLEKAFVGRVCIPGSAYNIQNYLEMEGVYAIKATPIGGNCCLLEELEVGYIGDLIKEGESWWKSLFSTIEHWEVGSLDGHRDVWFRIYGVPLHAWCPEFFVALGEFWGRFVCLDENTSKGESLDVARILVNIPLSLRIPEVVTVNIDGVKHNLCVREDAYNFFKQYNDIRRAQPSAADSSESSDSEFDRLAVDSSSGCSVSVENVELEIKVGSSDKVGGGIEKESVLPVNLCASPSGKVSEEVIRDKVSAPSEVNSVGVVPRLADSISKSATGDLHSGAGSGLLRQLVSEAGDMISPVSRSFSNCSDTGLLVLKDTNKGLHSGDCSSVGDGVPSESSMSQNLNNFPCVKPASSVVPYGFKPVSLSGKGADLVIATVGDILHNHRSGSSVREAASPRRGSAPEYLLPLSRNNSFSGLRFDPTESKENGISVSVSASSNAGDSVRAGLLKNAGPAVVMGSDSIEDTTFCLAGAASPKGACDVMLNGNESSHFFADSKLNHGGRGRSKPIRKVSLKPQQNDTGKGIMIANCCSRGNLKGALSLGRNRGNVSKCYGEQSEESDIVRNNGRQWELLKREVGDRLREAMNALGVTDRVEGNFYRQGSDLSVGGRMEYSELKQ